MDETEAAEIRKWAYDRAACMSIGKGEEKRVLTLPETLTYADQVAAWVMSGKLPANDKTVADE